MRRLGADGLRKPKQKLVAAEDRRRRYSLLLTGYFDRGNLGDNAMRDGLSEYAKCRWPEAEIRWMPLPNLSPRKLATLRPFFNEFRRADAVVLAGGTHFHDDYGLRSLKILASHLMLFALARVLGTSVGYAGIGLEPLRTKSARMLAKSLIAIANVVLVRDRRSLKLARDFWPRANVIVGFDSVALLPMPPRNRSPETFVVGLCLLPFFALHKHDPKLDNELVYRLSSALKYVHSLDPHLRVRVLVCFQGNRDSDLPISLKLVSALAPEVPTSLRVCSQPKEALAEFAELDALIATRYHAALFGYLIGCPTLTISYQDKCDALAEELGLSADAVWQPEGLHDREKVVQVVQALRDKPERFSMTVNSAQLAETARNGLDSFGRLLFPEFAPVHCHGL